MRPRALLLLALAALAFGCQGAGQGNGELEARVTQLELELAQMQERLAAVPDVEGLETASPEELVRRLANQDVVSRYRAVKELSRRSPTDVQELLISVIASGAGRERLGAASVFALKSWPEASGDLMRLHADETEPKVRALLALALGRSGGIGAAEALHEDLDHDSRTVRLAAVQALDRLGAAESGGRLLRAALDSDVHVASTARGALARLPESAFLFVQSEWDWLGPRERLRAVELIAQLEGDQPMDFLRGRLDDAAPLVALAAARELARAGDDSGGDLAAERLRSEDPVIARAAREVMDALQAGR